MPIPRKAIANSATACHGALGHPAHSSSNKEETIVQSSVLKGSEQLFASKYRTVLPTEAELIAGLERERRVIEQQKIGGAT
jgi:hypothetical protein